MRCALILAALAGLACGRTEVFERRSAALPSATTGCADGARDGFTDLDRWPAIAACAGGFDGFIDDAPARALCSAGWHVCTGDDPAIGAVTLEDARAFSGCFAFDAAHDCHDCFARCRPAIGACQKCCVSGAPTDPDMAGVGAACTFWDSGPQQSCLATGRSDATTNDFGCGWRPGLTGVVCCRA